MSRLVFREHFEPDQAVVHQHGVADLDVVDQVLIVDVDRTNLLGAVATVGPA